MVFLRLWVACSITMPLIGCGHGQSVRIDQPDSIEYFETGGYGVRILLRPQGARVDIRGEEHTRTVLVPVAPRVVERLARTIMILSDPEAMQPASDAERLAQRVSGVEFICRRAGQERTIRMGYVYASECNLVWKGIIQEIEAAASLDLARAVDAYIAGEAFANRGQLQEAIESYQDALKAYIASMDLRNGRWWITDDSAAITRFEYSAVGETHAIIGFPTDTMALPGMTREIAVKLLHNACWPIRECIGSRRDDVTIVDFSKAVIGYSGVSPTIAVREIDELMQAVGVRRRERK